MNNIISAINQAPLIPRKGKRGGTLFDFEQAFLRGLEKKVADHIQTETGHSVASFGDDEPRNGVPHRDFFNPKIQENLKEGFSERLRVSVEEKIAALKKEVPTDRLSFMLGITLCVGCGAWDDEALFDLEWRPVIKF